MRLDGPFTVHRPRVVVVAVVSAVFFSLMNAECFLLLPVIRCFTFDGGSESKKRLNRNKHQSDGRKKQNFLVLNPLFAVSLQNRNL